MTQIISINGHQLTLKFMILKTLSFLLLLNTNVDFKECITAGSSQKSRQTFSSLVLLAVLQLQL